MNTIDQLRVLTDEQILGTAEQSGIMSIADGERPTACDYISFARDLFKNASSGPFHLTEDQLREEFEDLTLAYVIERRHAGQAHNDNGAPTTKESLFWRDDNGAYGVIVYNPAWWAYKEAMKKVGRLA